MISRIKGVLTKITEETALVENGGMFYEIMLPSALADRLKNNGKVGEKIVFETIYYIEAGDRKSSHYPRLVGFTNPIDREFFSLMTNVSGLGVKKALKSLTIPIRDIATAIETKDTAQLNRLPGIGARLAEKIVAELHGKVAKFALSKETEPLSKQKKQAQAEPIVEEALDVLAQLQYTRNEAQKMIETALESQPKVSQVEDLIEIVFKNERQKVT
ncbi:MAG: Holliday junction branch migration protein RuvA [candidate division Zixibacteria bacterium]|nr:Holliday junction branch migration protein RuvA [candidate division Zixibacteria bacterium]